MLVHQGALLDQGERAAAVLAELGEELRAGEEHRATEAAGHTRVAQMNSEVLANLEAMIGQIEHEPERTVDAG